jgi:hypothetical protein
MSICVTISACWSGICEFGRGNQSRDVLYIEAGSGVKSGANHAAYGLAARGRSLERRVTAKRGWILGDDDETIRIHWEESATTKTARFRRNPLGAGAVGPQALSFVGHDVKTSLRSSLRACNPKTPARGSRDFCHGLVEDRQFMSRPRRGRRIRSDSFRNTPEVSR